MNTEDDEFNRIERESKQRMVAVQYALQKLHEENERLGLYQGVYETSPIPLITDEEWAALNEEQK